MEEESVEEPPIVEEKYDKEVMNEGNNTEKPNTEAPCFWVHNQNNTSPYSMT